MIFVATAQSVIKSFMSSLDNTAKRSTAAVDEAVAAVSNFSSWSELTSTMVKDCKAYNGDYAGFLKDMCDIVLDNDDTGAIIGSDAGGSTVKTAESIVPESGDWTYPSSTTFTVEGLTVTVPEKSQLGSKAQFIVGGLYTWWIKESLNLIKESYGLSFNEDGTTVKAMDVKFYNSNNGRLAYVTYSKTRKTTELHLYINLKYYNSIDTEDPNGASGKDAQVYLDRTIAHELTHAVMAANIDYFNDLPTILKEGTAELVHGIDDKRESNIINLASKSTSLNSALTGSSADTYATGYIALRYLAKQASENRDPKKEISVSSDTNSSTSTSTTPTTTNSSTSTSTSTTPTTTNTSTSTTTSTTPTTTDSSTSTTTTPSATFNSNNTVLTVIGNFSTDIWLNGNPYTGQTDTYTNSATVTINASQQTGNKIILAGNKQDNVITAGSGGSSLWGGSGGNDTLIGGSGRDMFWFTVNGNDDVVRNFATGTASNSDILYIGTGISSMTRNDGTLRLEKTNGSSLSVDLSNSDVNDIVQYSTDGTKITAAKIGNTNSGDVLTYESNIGYYFAGGGENTLSISGGESVDVWLSESKYKRIQIIDASSATGNVLMAGDTEENRIIGGTGNSSLWGGRGSVNDTLIGGSGNDIFYYGLNNGNDVIQNAEDGDVVRLFNISFENLVSARKIDSNLVIAMDSGDTLTVLGESTATFSLADGRNYKYDHDGGKWIRA